MSRTISRKAPPERISVRCAVYTRKSTEEGLEKEFNSLDAQRESGEAYIKSQLHEGWECLPEKYDDGGFTGGNLERPALKRLMNDIEEGKIDCVVVYKVDRLSRSLLDFARLMETFDKHRIAFVSVTQQFNTASSMGRLVLNVLLSFAQFEREIISERTRDKIAAARRKGKWSGGMPLLGYDLAPTESKLVINNSEAEQVRTIFDLYLEHQGLISVVTELNRRGWKNKQWTTRKGVVRGGKSFTKTSLYKLLTNVVYTGRQRYKDEIHNGEHDGIVDLEIWQRVQSMLKQNAHAGGPFARNKFAALLKGLLHCESCKAAMIPTYTSKKNGRRYRYYVCSSAQKRGWNTCPSKAVPGAEMERFVVEQIRSIGKDHELIAKTTQTIQEESASELKVWKTEQRQIEQELTRLHREISRITEAGISGSPDGDAASQLAGLLECLRAAESRSGQIREQIIAIEDRQAKPGDVAKALDIFHPVWDCLSPQEQTRILHLLIERVDYHGATGSLKLSLLPAGIRLMAHTFNGR
ncbi:MAG: recombinase family protein [Planctomycetaceae bacterium]|jgi:site-specific DNA recombinase|nr:recombinase family protein [Planctomycetaceae bacterium]